MVAKLKHKSASVTLRPTPEGTVWVANLFAEDRNQGHARELMEQVVTKADNDGIVLQLDARQYGRRPYGMNNGELILFYESLGFVRVSSPVKNLMERQPHTSQEIQPL